MSKGRILVVDDEAVVRESLDQWFQEEGYETGVAANAREALEAAQRQSWDLALLDIKMPGMDGIELQKRLMEAAPSATVILMTGYATVESAIQAFRRGAYDYILKPIDPEELSHLAARAIGHKRAVAEVGRLREQLREVPPRSGPIGSSGAMRRIAEMVEMVAATDATVLITGESGTGKEVVARAIHDASPRRRMPMVTIHCGALTETLLESELFGHERGAFTGAQFRKKGKFEAAEGGTVFLDEIGDISLKTQTDLLRVLQEKEIVRVGGNEQIKVDFRSIAAANRSLEEMVKEGTFRPDLYYRLHVVTIHVPPLRERREDIPLLAAHFLKKLSRGEPPGISAAAMEALLQHDWPGNVRELENAIERALVLSRGKDLAAADFAFSGAAQSAPGRTLDEVERAHIERVYRECGGNHSRTARLLGIDRTTLYNKLRRYGAGGTA